MPRSNETHFRGLTAVKEARGAKSGLQAAFFIHIPFAAHDDGNKEELATVLSVVIAQLVEETRKAPTSVCVSG